MAGKIILDENPDYGKVDVPFKIFHQRRILDAIWGMASIANDHKSDGTCADRDSYVLTCDSTREQRLDEIFSSLRCINVMTWEEERLIKNALFELRHPPKKCPTCGKEMD